MFADAGELGILVASVRRADRAPRPCWPGRYDQIGDRNVVQAMLRACSAPRRAPGWAPMLIAGVTEVTATLTEPTPLASFAARPLAALA